LASSSSRFCSFFESGAATGGAALNAVAATLKGLLGDENGLDGANGLGGATGVAAEAGVGAAGGATEACGANANGEFGELKIDGTAGPGGGGVGGAAGGGLVNGSGYWGIVLAAAENGFGVGMYCDCCAGCQSGVTGGDAGAAADSSVSCCPGGGGTRPSATSRGSSMFVER